MTDRTPLPNLRTGLTIPVKLRRPGRDDLTFDATFNFGACGRVQEVFMRSTKEGNDLSSLLVDGCIAISLLLQRGETMAGLAAAFGENRAEGQMLGPPSSPLGAIARAGADLDQRAAELLK